MTRNSLNQLIAALSHPDQHRRVSPGLTLGNDAEPIAAPLLGSSIIQRSAKLEAWGEIDLVDEHRYMRIHVFGAEDDLLGLAAVQYFNPAHKPSFDAPQFNAGTDMLLMMVTATTSDQMARRLFALEDNEDITRVGVRQSILSLVSAIKEHSFIESLDIAAIQRGRTRLVLHSLGDNQRYKQLLDGLGFKRQNTSDGFVFIREVIPNDS